MLRTILTVCAWGLMSVQAAAQSPHEGSPSALAGLQAASEVTRDIYGIAHVEPATITTSSSCRATSMRRIGCSRWTPPAQASGTLAELLGPGALASDVELRTLGIRRAAVRSLAVISPESRAALEAYCDGVNAYVRRPARCPRSIRRSRSRSSSHGPRSTASPSRSRSPSACRSASRISTTLWRCSDYTAVFDPGSTDGRLLFSEDLWRAQPFYPASTVPDASVASAAAPLRAAAAWTWRRRLAVRRAELAQEIRASACATCRSSRTTSTATIAPAPTSGRSPAAHDERPAALRQRSAPRARQALHLLPDSPDGRRRRHDGQRLRRRALRHRRAEPGYRLGRDGQPAGRDRRVRGAGCPGRHLRRAGLSTLYLGTREPVIPIPETYRVNNSRRRLPDNLSPVPLGRYIPACHADRAAAKQWADRAARSGDRRGDQHPVHRIQRHARARHVPHSESRAQPRRLHGRAAILRLGHAELRYADVAGNIAYFASSEVPLREDLQAQTVTGAATLVHPQRGRAATSGCPCQHPQPGQAIPYEILPAAEMPHLVNPPAGWFVNANNDPAGTVLDNNPLNQLRPGGGLLLPEPGVRRGLPRRAHHRARSRRSWPRDRSPSPTCRRFQADVVLPDAQFFVPFITQALRARHGIWRRPAVGLPRESAAVREAVGRLAAWSLTTPTGIPQGYDANDSTGCSARRRAARSRRASPRRSTASGAVSLSAT